MLPVLVEELELERVRDLRRRDPRLRDGLEPADHEAADLLLDVDVAVGVTEDRQVRVHALELVGDDVEVLGRVQRHRDADLVAEGLGPLAGAVDDDLGLDVTGVRPYAGHAPSACGLGRVDAEDPHPLVDADAVAARTLGEREGEVRRVGPPVLGQPDGTEQVVDGDDRPALLGLLGGEHLAVEVEGRSGGGRSPQLRPSGPRCGPRSARRTGGSRWTAPSRPRARRTARRSTAPAGCRSRWRAAARPGRPRARWCRTTACPARGARRRSSRAGRGGTPSSSRSRRRR